MLKEYNDFTGGDFADYEHNWKVQLNDETESWWEYKEDAIDRILEIIDIEEFEYEGEFLSVDETRDVLLEEDEENFYQLLDEIKSSGNNNDDIKLFNIQDKNELEFIMKDADDFYEEE